MVLGVTRYRTGVLEAWIDHRGNRLTVPFLSIRPVPEWDQSNKDREPYAWEKSAGINLPEGALNV